MILVIYLGVINILAFICYGLDKKRAKNGQWRISEAHLLALAALGGALGALLGMLVFHHKTRKRKFTVTVPLFLVLWIAFSILTLACFYGWF